MAPAMVHINNPCMRRSHVVRFPSSEGAINGAIQHSSFTKVSTLHETLISSSKRLPLVPTRALKMSTHKTCNNHNNKTTFTSLARRWREVQGLRDWENLIEPLDPLLQKEIIRYGKFVVACYKAFDLNPNSPRYLNCKYGKRTVLRDVGMADLGYEVTQYIYATPEIINIPMQKDQSSSCGRWVGYVAVSCDDEVKKLGRRDVVVTFRGTITRSEWIANLMSSLTPACLDPHNPRLDVKVETGFLSLYTSSESESRFGLGSCREQLLSEISRLLNKYKDEEEELSITIAGHSMGSSLAVLLGYDLAELGLNVKGLIKKVIIPITIFSFAGPRVGNLRFKERCEELGVKVLRIVNVKDPVTKLPGILFNENFQVPWTWCSCYVHVGVELVLDFFKLEDIFCVHDLETYISLLKCPKICRQQLDRKKGLTISSSKAKELLFKTQIVKNISPWRDADVINIVMNMVYCLDGQEVDESIKIIILLQYCFYALS